MKLHVHNNIIVIYIRNKFQEISFIGHLVMAEDGKKSLAGGQDCIDCIETQIHNRRVRTLAAMLYPEPN